jgi:hypothetical protein
MTKRMQKVATQANPLNRRIDLGAISTALGLVAIAILIDPSILDPMLDAIFDPAEPKERVRMIFAGLSVLYLTITRPKPDPKD